MNIYKHYILPIILGAFLLLPHQVFAEDSTLNCTAQATGGVCGVPSVSLYTSDNGEYGDSANNTLTGSTVWTGNWSGYPWYLYQFGTPIMNGGSFNSYYLSTGNKYEFIYKITTNSRSSSSQFADTDIYYRYISLSGVSPDNEIIEHDFLETGSPFSYVNFGLKKVEETSGYVYYIVLDLIPKTDLIGFRFNFLPKIEEPTDTSISILRINAIAGTTYYDYYEPIFTINSMPFQFAEVASYSFQALQVEDFSFLETKIDKPIIPLPEGPGYDPYHPDNSALDNLDVCESDNLLDRFSCFFKNFQEFFKNIFVRIGEAVENLVGNLIKFFNSILNPDVDDSTSNGGGFFDNFTTTDNGGISSIVTMPLRLIQGLVSGENACTNLSFSMMGKDMYFPSGCILWSKVPDSMLTIYHTIICGSFAYFMLIKLFKDIEKLKNPNNDEVSTLDL